MGVPKFYRYFSERYPCLSEVVKENQIPEFDNFYLDMNGIIHTCSHPNDDDPHFRISEQKIFQDIFHYLEVLFRIIRPRKVFFMAVDGVAPRAKMNQQRGRRFMSAVNALNLAEQAKRRGEVLPTEDRFDSNCITPGTAFMVKLHEQLKFFVRMKISTDESWRGIQVFLSGHDVPGEGEHKIMEFIRHSRSQLGYDPNTRHCLYGLDADLIMLGLSSHEPHFSLLREEVKFIAPKKQKARTVNAEESTFHLLHLSLFREYIDYEFSHLRDKLSFKYDLESIIDDWILMGFLVGNDFIPNLPHLHIQESAFPILYGVYEKVMPTLNGYLNEAGYLNLPRFEKFLMELSRFDRDHFGDEYVDMKYLEGKTYKEVMEGKMKDIRTIKVPESNRKIVDRSNFRRSPMARLNKNALLSENASDELKQLIDQQTNENQLEDAENLHDIFKHTNSFACLDEDKGSENIDNLKRPNSVAGFTTNNDLVSDEVATEPQCVTKLASPNIEFENDPTIPGQMKFLQRFYGVEDNEAEDDESEDDWSPEMEKAFLEHKRGYYRNKLEFEHLDHKILKEQAIGYITAIQWNLHYYYNGCASWSWFYPHHYSPYLSDIVGFSDLEINFDLGIPFKPFQQLLAVLPAHSRKLLPSAYQDLMTDENSPIITYYPETFKTDLNGKAQEWEAVVLIPFIDQDRLVNAMTPKDALLTADERKRNSIGNILLFETSEDASTYVKRTHKIYHTTLPGIYPDITHDLCNCHELSHSAFKINVDQIIKGLLSCVNLDIYFPGFPTFKHIPVTHETKRIGVRVFQSNSKHESIILGIQKRPEFSDDYAGVASKLLGKDIYVNWPYLTSAKACSLVTKELVFTKDFEGSLKKRDADLDHFERDENNIGTRLLNSRAIDTGIIEALIYVRPVIGTRIVFKENGLAVQDKEYAEMTVPYALQTVVERIHSIDKSTKQHKGKFKTIAELFPVNSELFVTNSAYYGCQGSVKKIDENGKVHVRLTSSVEPEMQLLLSEKRSSSSQNSKLLSVQPRALLRPTFITGNILPDKNSDFRIHDRVVCVRYGLSVPIGLRGTIINISTADRAFSRPRQTSALGYKLEVIFDEEFPGGHVVSEDDPRRSKYKLTPSAFLNLSYGWRCQMAKRDAEPTQILRRAEPTSSKPSLSTQQQSLQTDVTLQPSGSKMMQSHHLKTAGHSNSYNHRTESILRQDLPSVANLRFAQPKCSLPPSADFVDKLVKDPAAAFKAKHTPKRTVSMTVAPHEKFDLTQQKGRQAVNDRLKQLCAKYGPSFSISSLVKSPSPPVDDSTTRNQTLMPSVQALFGQNVCKTESKSVLTVPADLPSNPDEIFSRLSLNPNAKSFTPVQNNQFSEQISHKEFVAPVEPLNKHPSAFIALQNVEQNLSNIGNMQRFSQHANNSVAVVTPVVDNRFNFTAFPPPSLRFEHMNCAFSNHHFFPPNVVPLIMSNDIPQQMSQMLQPNGGMLLQPGANPNAMFREGVPEVIAPLHPPPLYNPAASNTMNSAALAAPLPQMTHSPSQSMPAVHKGKIVGAYTDFGLFTPMQVTKRLAASDDVRSAMASYYPSSVPNQLQLNNQLAPVFCPGSDSQSQSVLNTKNSVSTTQHISPPTNAPDGYHSTRRSSSSQQIKSRLAIKF